MDEEQKVEEVAVPEAAPAPESETAAPEVTPEAEPEAA